MVLAQQKNIPQPTQQTLTDFATAAAQSTADEVSGAVVVYRFRNLEGFTTFVFGVLRLSKVLRMNVGTFAFIKVSMNDMVWGRSQIQLEAVQIICVGNLCESVVLWALLARLAATCAHTLRAQLPLARS